MPATTRIAKECRLNLKKRAGGTSTRTDLPIVHLSAVLAALRDGKDMERPARSDLCKNGGRAALKHL